MNKVFLIADTHFGSDTIIRYEKRPFSLAKEMDETIIRNWNSVVDDGDFVFHLGDVADYDDEEKIKSILSSLNGRKMLIMGNHDRNRTAADWRALGFDEVSEWPIVYKDWFMLSHEPMYNNVNMPYANIYGHVHGDEKYVSASPQSFCACVERTDYAPIVFEEILKQMKQD